MFESTSTTAKSMSGLSSRSSVILGVRILQGSHHSAWKFTITALSALMTYECKLHQQNAHHDSRCSSLTFLSKSKWSLITNRLGLHADNESVFLRIDSLRMGVVLLIALNMMKLLAIYDEFRCQRLELLVTRHSTSQQSPGSVWLLTIPAKSAKSSTRAVLD